MSIPADRLTAIKRLPLLAKVPKSVSERLLRSAHLPHFGAGNILFREGDAPENLYLPICRSTPGAA
jgi:CRP-like cAMP-binding protein